jgi:hypothetical protein
MQENHSICEAKVENIFLLQKGFDPIVSRKMAWEFAPREIRTTLRSNIGSLEVSHKSSVSRYWLLTVRVF